MTKTNENKLIIKLAIEPLGNKNSKNLNGKIIKNVKNHTLKCMACPYGS